MAAEIPLIRYEPSPRPEGRGFTATLINEGTNRNAASLYSVQNKRKGNDL